MKLYSTFAITVTAVVIAFTPPARALINPAVQPRLLYDMYTSVFTAQVESSNSAEFTVSLRPVAVAKGTFDPESFTLNAPPEQLQAILSLQPGTRIVVFAGRPRARHNFIFYVGGGTWYEGHMDAEDPSQWTLVRNMDEGKGAGSNEIMFGVFNGAVEMLERMVAHLAKNQSYFPAQPFSRFSIQKIAQLDGPAGGVALFDVNGNARLDILVTSEAGTNVFIQNAAGAFENASEAMGIAGIPATSVGLADVNGNGSIDLLLDGSLFRKHEGRWEKTSWLPELPAVKSAAFVELNRDGFPDVLLSMEGGGLRAFLNPFGENTDAESFKEVSGEMGLTDEESGAHASGYFVAGDFSGNGHTDIFFLAGSGYILLGGESEDSLRMEPVHLGFEEEHVYGTATMAPFTLPNVKGALVLVDDSKRLLVTDEDVYAEITAYGNEIQDDIAGLFSVLAEDLNADGTLDLYAANHRPGSQGFFCTNRGYGSFMLEEKYANTPPIPVEAYTLPARGLAAGDVNGDGANDLLISGLDGTVWLLINEVLTDRPLLADVSTRAEQRTQIETRLLTVQFGGGPGIVGAKIHLLNEAGELVAAREIGGNTNIGSTGPQQVVLAARVPGPHTLRVLFSNGTKHSQVVDLSASMERHQLIHLSR